MEHIKHYIDVSLYHIKLAVLTMLEYPANFVGWLLSNPIQFILGFATIKFVVASFGTINGWDYGHLAFLYGIAVISHAFSMIFFVQGWFMGGYVVRGDFDRYMLRPLSVLFQFFFTRFNVVGFTDLIPGICVFAYGCHKVHFQWNIGNVMAVVLLIIGATLIRGGIYIIMGTFSFWTKSMNDFAGFTQEFFDKTTMYPLSMYPRMMQIMLTYIIPIGWISYYPAKDLLSGVGTGAVISLVIGAVTMTLAALFFKVGLRSYESAGQ